MNENDYRLRAYRRAASAASRAVSGPKPGSASHGKEKPGASESEPARGDRESRADGVAAPSATSAAGDLARHGLIKVPVAPSEPDGRESIYRRIAKFLLLIGVDEAAKVISHLTQEQTEKIVPEIASIRSVDSDEAAVILAEFQTLVENSRQQGGVSAARDILEKAFGATRAEEMISRAVPFPEGKPFDYMQDMDGERVFLLLRDESAPVRALVLSRLRPAVAADVINRMDSGDKKDTVQRLAKLTAVSPDILRRIDRAMQEKVRALNTAAADTVDGRGVLAEIIKRMTPDAEKDMLSAISAQDPELVADLRERLFTMDDVLNADDRFVQKQLHSMSEQEIAFLVAGKGEDFRAKILSNVSRTRGDVILEEEELRKPMRRQDCDEATARFFAVLRRAWEDGTLVIAGRDDDVYV